MSLRNYRDELHYHHAKKQGLTIPLHLEDRIKEWKHWALIDNKFPYSAAFKTHHMLIPKRVATRKDLTLHEEDELQLVLDELNEIYDCYMINFRKKQSIPGHFHVHMLIYKDDRQELGDF